MEINIDNAGITKRVETLLTNHNITAYRLCKDLKIPHGSFANIKKGRQDWSLEYIHRIAIYFKVSIDYLVYGKLEELNEDENILYKIRTYEDELLLLRDKDRKYNKIIDDLKNLREESPQ